MSASNTRKDEKKKRLGSRRSVAKQNNALEVEFDTDRTFASRPHVPEENTESLSLFANPEKSISEGQHPRSPEQFENKRKLGSSRKSRGRQQGSATESYYQPGEEVEEKNRGNEALATMHMSLTKQSERLAELAKRESEENATHNSSLYSAMPSEVESPDLIASSEDVLESLSTSGNECKVMSDSCKSDEMLKMTHKSYTLQSKEFKKNSHPVDFSDISSQSVVSCPTVEQQHIDKLNSREMPDKLFNMYSAIEEVNSVGDEDTDLLWQDGNLHSNRLMSESHVESLKWFSANAERTQNAELECSISLPFDDKSADKVQNEHVSTLLTSQPQETDGSTDAQTDIDFNPIGNSNTRGNKVFETTKISSLIQTVVQVKSVETDNRSSQVKAAEDLVGNSELNSSFVHQSSSVNTQLIGPQVVEDKIDEFPSTHAVKKLQQKNCDDPEMLTQQVNLQANSLMSESPVTSENMDSSMSAEIKTERKSTGGRHAHSHCSVEQTKWLLPKKEEFTNQEQTDHVNILAVKQAQHSTDNVTKVHEQAVISTQLQDLHDVNPFENTTCDNVENSVTLQTMRPEELRQDTEQDIIISETDDKSLYSASIPGYSSEVMKLINYPEADQESLIHQTENIQAAWDRETDFKVDTFNQSVAVTLEVNVKSQTLQSEVDLSTDDEQNEHFHLPEVRTAHDSVDAVNKELEQEIQPTQMQELQEIDYSHEDKTHDLTQSSDNCSGSQKDQSELVELIVESTDNFITVQEDSHPGDSQGENPTQESDVVILHQTNADHYPYDAMKPQIDDLERAVTAVDQDINNECQVEDDRNHCADQSSHEKKDGLFSEHKESKSYQVLESEIHTHLGSQPQDSSVNINEENSTDFTQIGNRRKLGSSRKKKGRYHVKESSAGHTEEIEENIPVSEVLETTTETSALQTWRPEELRQDTEQDIIISETDDVSLYSASIPGYSSEVLKLIKYPDADQESLIHQSENLQEACEEQNEHFHLPEVRTAHDSVDAVNKELEQEIEPTQMQELQEIDYSHEDKTHDLTQSSDNCSGSQKDQSELVELIVESTDNFITVQEDSHPGDSQGENPTQESDVVILHQTNADHYPYDAMKPQIDDLERAVTAVDQDINNECQVEDDRNHCADQSSHQKKDGLFSEDEESKSFPVLESEIHTHLGSQPQDSSVNIDKENNTDLNQIGNRRKLGSSRKKKGRHPVKESSAGHTEENEENIPVSEVLETTTETSALQTMRPEELRQDTEQDIIISETDDVSLYSASIPGYSSEVLKLIKYPDADQESLIHQSENLQEACEEQNEHFHLPEVRTAHDSVDAVNKELEQEIEPTQMQELQEIDYSSEDKTHDLTQSSDNCSGSQKDQSELVELIVESTDNFITVQEDSHPGDSQGENPTQESDVVILHQTNADHYPYDAMKPQIDDLERAVTAVDQDINNECQVEDDRNHCADQSSHEKKDGLFSEHKESKSYQVLESEIHTHLGSQPQDSSVNINEENNTDFTQIGNRRKLGSSRKKKGRHHVKESSAGYTEEIEENIPVSEVLETTTKTSALQTMRPEELRQDTEQDIIISETDDISLYSASIPGYSSEVLKLIKYPDADQESLIHQSEKLQEACEEQNEHFHLPEVRTAHDSVDAVNKELEQEIEPTQMQELQEIDYSSEDKTHDLTQSSDNCSGSQKDQSELVELIVESTDNFITVQEDSHPGDSQGENPTQESDVVILHQTNADHYPYDAMKPQIDDLERAVTAVDQDINNECQVEDDRNHCADQSSHEKKDGLFSEDEESKSFPVLESEIHTHLGSQPQDSSVNIDKENNTDLNQIGNRRKLGSSRKKKGRHPVKESSAGHTEEIEENITVSEVLETTTETSALQTWRPEELRQDTEQDIIISETDDVSLYSASIPGYSSEVLKLIKYPDADQESLIHQSENLQEACEEQNEHFHLPEVRAAHDSVDAVNKELEQEIEPTQMQELQEIDYSSEDKTHDLTQSSDNCSGSQKDQSELVELIVESTDNFITVQEDSHPGDSQGENPTQESDVVILHQTNADHYPYDAMKPQIDDLERAVTAVDQDINNECQVEDDRNHCADQSSHEKKDGLFSEHKESKSFPVLESEIHTHLGSQPQDSSVNIDKENNTDFTQIGNRRKLGSSRKKKGRHPVKESSAGHTEEIEENITVSEVLETTTETSALQTWRPEELRQDTEQDIIISETDDVSLYSASIPGYSSEVLKLIKYPDADQESLIHQSENLQEACEEQNEHFHLPEVRAAHDSVDAVNKELEQEIEPTQMQELQEIDYSHEDKTHDLTQSSDNCSGSQKDQSELVELIVESTDNFITVQEDSHPGDSQGENPTQESDVVILHQTNADHYPYDAMKPQIDDLERAVTAVDQDINNECQVEDDRNHCADQSSHEKKDGLFSEHKESKSYQVLESEIHTHLGSQPQDSSVNINEENNTDFTQIGNRRKLGSSRKKKGRHHVKESSAGHKEEIEENIPVSEVLETTTETSALQTMRPEELRQDTEQDIIISETDDVSLYSASIPGYSSEVLKLIKYPDADQESLIHQSEKLQEACEEQNEHFHLPEVRTAHDSVDAVNKELEQEIEPTQMQELQEIDYSSEDKTHDLTQSSDNCSGSQKDQSELVELIVESTDNFITVQEDSHPGDSQGENPTQESDVVILHQTNADHYPYDAMKPQIDDLERVVTAVDQDINNECQVEDDRNHCADQSSHQKKDGLFFEDEESKSFPFLESEIHTHLGSQPQDSSVNIDKENITDFTQIGNRRKLGSSRKKKGRRHVKEFSAGHTEEIEENIPVSEVLETTTETSALQTMRPEELRQDTEQDIIISETDDVSLYSASIPGYSSEVLKLIKYPDADQESLIHQSENLQEACEEQNEHFHLPEVRTAHDSVDAVNKELEQEIEPTQMQELQEIDYSSEDKTHDLTQSSDNCSGSQKDQSELVELIVESTDNFITVQEDSHPGDSQGENPTQESDVVILHQTNADHYPYDAMKPQIDDLERAVTAVDQDINNECQVEDDRNHCADQSSHEKKDGLFSEHKESKSYQVLESEIHTHLGSQPQDSSVNINEENNTDFTQIGNRRKLGSSRKKKGRHHVKESSAGHTEEIEENIPVSEVLETTTETSALQTMRPEELRQDTEQDIIISETDDVSLYSASIPGYSSEVLKLIKYPDADQESLIHQSEKLQEACEEQNEHFHLPEVRTAHDSVDAVNKELEQEIEPTQMQELQEIDYSSEDKTHDLTQSSDNCSGSQKDQSELVELIVESTDNFITVQEDSHPGDSQGENPTQESDVVILHQTNADHYPYDAMKPQIDDLERVVTAVDQDINNECQVEDDINHCADQSSHQKKDGLFFEDEESKYFPFLESEIHTHLGSQPQDSSVNIDKENITDFTQIGNRRKLGSSRKKKGRRHVKEFSAGHTEEIEENIPVSEVLETTTETSALQTMRPEELRQDTEQDIIISETDDVSLYSASIPGYSSEVLKLIKYPDADQESLIHQSENLQEACEEQNEHFHLPEVRAAHDSVDAVNKELEQEIQPTQMQELKEIVYSSEDKTHDLTQSSDNCSGSQKDQSELVDTQSTQMQQISQIYYSGVTRDGAEHSNIISVNSKCEVDIKDTHQSELSVKSVTDDPAARHEVINSDKEEHPTESNNFKALDQLKVDYHAYATNKPQKSEIERVDNVLKTVYENECQEENEIKSCAEHKSHLEKDILSSKLESEYSLKALHSEMHALFDPRNPDNSVSIDEQHNTGFSCTGSKRRLGCSRRNKGPQNFKNSVAESYQKPTDQSDFTDLHDKKCPHVSSVTDTESKEREKDTELWGILQASSLLSDLHLKSDHIGLSVTMEGTTGKNSPEEHTELKCIVEQPTVLSPYEVTTNEEQRDRFNLTEVRGVQNSKNTAKKVHEEDIKSTQLQEMHQISNISDKEDKPSVQTLPLDSQPQDYCKSIEAQTETVTGFKFTGTKRKLGSSRRNKGSQHGLDSVTETHRKCEEEVLETTCCDESSETTKVSSSIETTRLEKLKQQTDPGVKPAEKITLLNEGETTKKVQEENTTLSQNIIETTMMVSVDITRSDKDDSLKFSLEFSEGEKKNNRNELKNLTSLTDYGSVKMDLTPDASSLKDDSALQRMSCDDIVSCRSVISNVLCQEEAFHVQNTESLSCVKVLLEQELDVGDSKKSAKFSAMDAQRSQQSVQEETHLDSNENLEGKSTQRRRKMGSSRKLIRKPEEQVDDKDNSKQSNLDTELDRIKVGHMEVVEELPPIVTPQVSLNERQLSLSSVYEEQQEDSERNVGEEPSQLNDSAIHIPSVVAGRNRRSVSPLLSPNTEDAINSDCIPVSFNEIAQNNELIQEGIKGIPDHALKSQETPVPDLKKVKSLVRGAAGETNVQASVQELYSTNQEACNTNVEMKAASPNFSSTNRRRKLGSTRKIPGSQSKREDFCEKQEVVNEVTVPIVGDDLTGNASGVKEPQLYQNVEESHAPLSQVVETEHQVSSGYLSAEPSTSTKPNVMSESASGGRRRKMGSHRKSRGNPNCEDQVAGEDSITYPQKGGDVRGMTDESGIKTINEHSDECLVLDTISEVGESDKKPSSNISSSRPGESPRPVSQKVPKPETQVITATPFDSVNQKKLSLVGESTGAAVGSKSFNVMMVGDTSVGKTSFMKRAHSGKFSFDLPASVGLDSCKWTVVVDGKPVILHLWDTAGQERFHSITRHIFHKAQAFLLMYDITSPKSFSAVSYWANCIQEGAPDNVTVLLLGNKSDRADRQVKTQDGEILAKEYNFKFMECSAATGENVIQCLENMARMLSQKADTTQEAMVLKKESQQKQRSGCC